MLYMHKRNNETTLTKRLTDAI